MGKKKFFSSEQHYDVGRDFPPVKKK